jgi:hypothetical protein
MAPGRIRLELVRIRRQIRRAAELQGDVRAILDQANKDHQRCMRELKMVKNGLLRDELRGFAARVQAEGRAVRERRL